VLPFTVNSTKAAISELLPLKYEPLLLTFYHDGIRLKGDLILIGDDYGTSLYLDPANGQIRSIDDGNELPTRFINSDLSSFARFISEYDKAIVHGPKSAIDLESNQVAHELRARFMSIDPLALSNPESWWATILEQLEDGLL
jgi:hypothetical protein